MLNQRMEDPLRLPSTAGASEERVMEKWERWNQSIAMKTRKNPDPAALHVPAQWYSYYQNLQSIRESLLSDSAEQLAEFEEPLEAPGTDVADNATDEFDHELTLGILAREDDALFEVDAAIQRILDGTYGICEKTGKPIPEARLKAVPWTRYTKQAQELLEHRKLVGRPHLEPVESIQGPPPGGLAQAPDPEEEEPIAIETRRRRREQGVRDLAGDVGVNVASALKQEP
jgi:RNA polymerase-binding protein DksA